MAVRGALPDPNFWAGKRVLLTGHTGFKGSWLSLWLQSMHVELRGIALPPPTNPSMFEVARVAQGMDHCLLDIRDYAAVGRAISEFKPEIIFHMAAQPLVRYAYHNPVETYSTNVMGTVHVLEAARHAGSVRAIVNVTTDKCYENREWVWGYRETDALGGSEPYANSKACSELISQAYRESYFRESGISLATARAGNVIGGGDWAQDRLIPDILRALEKNVSPEIRNPDAIRPWQHVLDPLCGYLLLAELLCRSEEPIPSSWNFGPPEQGCQPVRYLANSLCALWSEDLIWTAQISQHPKETNSLRLDASQARQILRWIPRLDTESMVQAIIIWHKAFLAGERMREYSINTLHQFSSCPTVTP